MVFPYDLSFYLLIPHPASCKYDLYFFFKKLFCQISLLVTNVMDVFFSRAACDLSSGTRVRL